MSLINRMEVINYLYPGKSRHAEWRNERFVFHGKSAAVVIPNGGGKSTVTNAFAGMMSRNRHLLGKARELMAPSGTTHSHIRVEFLRPVEKGLAQHILPMKGLEHDIKGETWVFGMCGNSGRQGDLRYYFYRGKLEQTNLIDTCNEKEIRYITNEAFREKLRSIASATGPGSIPQERWLEAIHEHISPQQIRQLCEFQIAGSGDKGAPLFNTPRVAGESLHQTFFYEHIAPQLAVGTPMTAKELEISEQNQGSPVEEKIVAATLNISRTLLKKKACEKELERYRKGLAFYQKITGMAQKIKDARTKQEEVWAAIDESLAFLATIIQEDPVPGIPVFKPSCNDLVDVLVKQMVIIPNQHHPVVIKDKGVAELLGNEVKRVNQLAGRNNLRLLKS